MKMIKIYLSEKAETYKYPPLILMQSWYYDLASSSVPTF